MPLASKGYQKNITSLFGPVIFEKPFLNALSSFTKFMVNDACIG